MAKTLTIEFATGTPQPGIWCGSCLLPSAFKVDIHRLCPAHAAHPVATVRYCPDCGDWEQGPFHGS